MADRGKATDGMNLKDKNLFNQMLVSFKIAYI